jgi:NADH dehydrogenase/NADH:ubiquinone oxidoreductase subunit G
MTTIHFKLDGRNVEARADETIWQVAKRIGTDIPHLCHRDAHGYRPDGNCRACWHRPAAASRPMAWKSRAKASVQKNRALW